MKIFFFIFYLVFSTLKGYSQTKENTLRTLKIIEIKSHNNAFLLTGVDSGSPDTIFFISVIKKGKYSHKRKSVILLNSTYQFNIVDIDKEIIFPQSPYKQGVKFDQTIIKRNGRDGNTFETTQYYSYNTNGLYIVNSNDMPGASK